MEGQSRRSAARYSDDVNSDLGSKTRGRLASWQGVDHDTEVEELACSVSVKCEVSI